MLFYAGNFTSCENGHCLRGPEYVCSLHGSSKHGVEIVCSCRKGYMVDEHDTSRCVGKKKNDTSKYEDRNKHVTSTCVGRNKHVTNKFVGKNKMAQVNIKVRTSMSHMCWKKQTCQSQINV